MKLVVSFCAVLFLALAEAANFQDCGSETGKFTKIAVSNCGETDTDCILQRNSNATISIDFTSDTESPTLKSLVFGNVMGMSVPFALPKPDACTSGVTCPIQKGENYEYRATLPVLKSYPKVKVIVKWVLQDSTGKSVVCVKIPAHIK